MIFYYCPATTSVHQNNRETHLNSDTVELVYLTNKKQYRNIKINKISIGQGSILLVKIFAGSTAKLKLLAISVSYL